MYVSEPRGLLGNRLTDLRDAVPDGDYRRAARCVQITLAAHRVDEASLSPQRHGISLQEISWESSFVGHGPPGDQDSRARFARNDSHRSLKDERFKQKSRREEVPVSGTLTAISISSRQSRGAGISSA